VAFRIDLVLLDMLDTDWFERAVADMQRNRRPFHTMRGELVEQTRRDMQPRCWRRHRSRFACIDGLIALAIGVLVAPLDVRWKRNVTDALDGRAHALSGR